MVGAGSFPRAITKGKLPVFPLLGEYKRGRYSVMRLTEELFLQGEV